MLCGFTSDVRVDHPLSADARTDFGAIVATRSSASLIS